jgi:hypothetical protein
MLPRTDPRRDLGSIRVILELERPASMKTAGPSCDGELTAEGIDALSLLELPLDLRRRRKARLIRLAVPRELDELSVSLEFDASEELEELELLSISANTPGCDSSSITFWGVLSYKYACDLSWKRRYKI